MNKKIKSILWKCRRVIQWTNHLTEKSFPKKYYRKQRIGNGENFELDENYVSFYTVSKTPFDVSNKGRCDFEPGFVKPGYPRVQISMENLKAMHNLILVDNKNNSRVKCLEYGDSMLCIHISTLALSQVIVDMEALIELPAEAEEKTSKKRKRVTKKHIFRKIDYTRRARHTDDVVPMEIIVPAMVISFPFEPPKTNLFVASNGDIISHLHNIMKAPPATGSRIKLPRKRQLLSYFHKGWVGWYRDYSTTELWPYVLWDVKDTSPRPMNIKDIESMLGVVSIYPLISLNKLKEKCPNFQIKNFCEAVEKAGFNVDFQMMKEFGLSVPVQRNGCIYEAPVVLSSMATAIVRAYSKLLRTNNNTKQRKMPKKIKKKRLVCIGTDYYDKIIDDKIIDDEDNDDDDDDMEIMSSSSSSSSSSSTSSPASLPLIPEAVEPIISTNEIAPFFIHSEPDFEGYSSSKHTAWNMDWDGTEAAGREFDLLLMDSQRKILKKDHEFGEKLLVYCNTLVQKANVSLSTAKQARKHMKSVMSRIAQEKERYKGRQKKIQHELKEKEEEEEAQKKRENLKKFFLEQLDTMPDSVFLPGNEEQAQVCMNQSFKHVQNLFFIPPISTPPPPTLPLPNHTVEENSQPAPGLDLLTQRVFN